ncbi:MAG: hypothetical protein DMF62_04715 [Acidobacteria bacterium]|nr:MAG: hypothetical protein DMF62_04715 [Acidobacteriota bacterium]
MAPKTKSRPKAAPVVDEVDELDDDVELEELGEEIDDTPKKKAKRADSPDFGIQELCAFLERQTGKGYKPREVRTLIRKMARDGSGRVEREIVPGNRARYSWTGTKDPQVQAILAAVKEGEIESSRKEALDKLKVQSNAKKDAKKAQADAKNTAKGKTKVAEPDDDDDDADDLEELDDE